MPENPSSPQFSTAEYTSSPAADACKGCKTSLTGVYYRANGAMVCGSCAERIKRELPQDSHAAFVKALTFGIGGSVLGLALYAGFTMLTGIEIGYVSLAVGFIVGKAMMMGSGGIGGRRYQIVAIALTYAAVSLAAIPIAFHLNSKRAEYRRAEEQRLQNNSNPASESSSTEQQASQEPDQQQASSQKEKPSLAGIVGKLALIGLASPFLELEDGISGIIGLVILFVGMRFAWRMTAGGAGISVEGPYQNSASASA